MSAGIEILQGLPFNKHLGLNVVRADATGGEVHMTARPELENHIGSQHAGALFTVAEAASGAAILGAFGDQLATMTPLAREATIKYLKVARGTIVAKAKVTREREEVLTALANAAKGVDVDVEVELGDAAGVEVSRVVVKWHLRKHV